MNIEILASSGKHKILIYLGKLFLTDKGYFNWVAITSLIAIVTFIWTVWFYNKKYRADLISKARIDWMSEVRPLFAEYLAAVPKYMFMYNKATLDHDKDAAAALDDKMDEIKRLYYELNLYIPNNDSNKIVLRDIELLWGELSNIIRYYNYGSKRNLFGCKANNYKRSNYETEVDKYISGLINKTAIDGSKYFKDEWEKVKSGK